MKYGIFSQNTWLFPDSDVSDGKNGASLSLLKKQTGAFQVILSGMKAGEPIRFSVDGLDGVEVTAYREKEVCVNRNTNDINCGGLTTDNWEDISSYRVRKAPYRTYDALVPIGDLVSEACREVYYVTVSPSRDAISGMANGSVTFTVGDDAVTVPVTLNVGKKELPKSTLKLTNWFSIPNMANNHGLEYGTEEHVEKIKEYFSLLNECYNNVFRCTLKDMKVERVDGELVFDFSGARRWAQLALDCGAEVIEWADLIGRASWEDPPFLIYDAIAQKRVNVLSTGGRKYLTAFLSQFNDFLTENGWRDISIVHVSDEPKEMCAADFRIICGIFRKYLPGIKLIDAIEIYFLQDALDIYVPKDHYFQMNKNAFEDIRDERNELWFYTCNMPGGRWLNRFVDSPLLNTRLLHWGNYRYNLTGYLHWGFNHLRAEQDPFEETSGASWLPAGDTHIVYPYGDQVLRSLRFMQMKCGVEDYEILKAISLNNKKTADAICRRAMYSFDDYITDVDEFDAIAKDLVEAYDAM